MKIFDEGGYKLKKTRIIIAVILCCLAVAVLTTCKPREDCAETAFDERTTNYTAEGEKPLTDDFRGSEGHI